MTELPPLHPELTTDQWKRRALLAEAAVRHALWLRPMAYQNETAQQMATRFRLHIEATYPDLITRYDHQPTEVWTRADACGCAADAPGYDGDHDETDENGEALCSRSPLGRVCQTCEDEDGDGPEWLPFGVEWPCPPIAALNVLSDVSVLAARAFAAGYAQRLRERRAARTTAPQEH